MTVTSMSLRQNCAFPRSHSGHGSALAGTFAAREASAPTAVLSMINLSYTLQGGNPGDTIAQAEAAEIAVYVVAGFTVTVPDYEGENLDWGAGQESGYDTLDAIRATGSYSLAPLPQP